MIGRIIIQPVYGRFRRHQAAYLHVGHAPDFGDDVWVPHDWARLIQFESGNGYDVVLEQLILHKLVHVARLGTFRALVLRPHAGSTLQEALDALKVISVV